MRQRSRLLSKVSLICLTAGAAAGLASGLIPAFAQVIGDPLGLFSVGTSGESTSGTVLAVSNGGSANGGADGAGVSTTGTGSGGLAGASASGGASGSVAAVSGTGCASNGSVFADVPVAVSGTGCANSFGTAVSGTGAANGGLLGVSGTGTSTGLLSASGTGGSVGTYSADGRGEVRAEGQQVTLWTGALAAPTSPDQLLDPTFVAANTPSATEMATKNQNVALIMPVVLQDLATMTGLAATPSTPARSTSSCNPDGGGCPGPYKVLGGSGFGGWWFEQWQQTDSTCGPASTNEILSNLYNEGDTESQIADIEHGHNGTTYTNIPPAENSLFRSHGGGYNYFSAEYVGTDTSKLMGLLTWDVWYGPYNDGRGNGLILDVKPDTLPWWQAAGYHSPSGHYFSAFGYDHSGGGKVMIFDQFNYYALTGRNPANDKVYGNHWATLPQISGAMSQGQPFGEVIW